MFQFHNRSLPEAKNKRSSRKQNHQHEKLGKYFENRGKHFNSISINSCHPQFSICETQPPASIGWVALSSLLIVVRLFVCPASVTSPLISTIWCFRAYKPYIFCEDMILATCQCQHIFCCWVEPSLLLSSYIGVQKLWLTLSILLIIQKCLFN